MSIYPGDTNTFSCSVATSTGMVGTVTTAPLITIFRCFDLAVIITSQPMTAVPGSAGLYLYRWVTSGVAPQGDYIALVSYVTSLQTYTNQFLEKIKLGDTFITGLVAKDATVAKDVTVAKDSTVAHQSDVNAINPTNNATILGIAAKVNALPIDPLSTAVFQTLVPLVQDIRDYSLGSWSIDKTQVPNRLMIYRVNGTLLQVFRVYENTTSAFRQV